jgi:hypothetical protein
MWRFIIQSVNSNCVHIYVQYKLLTHHSKMDLEILKIKLCTHLPGYKVKYTFS